MAVPILQKPKRTKIFMKNFLTALHDTVQIASLISVFIVMLFYIAKFGNFFRGEVLL
jgi:hypothetical protein